MEDELKRNGLYVVQGEISTVVSAMRRNTRWSSSSQFDQDPMIARFMSLKEELAKATDLTDLKTQDFLSPFLDVIRSEVTTGPVTSVALSSVNKFLSYSLIENHSHEAAMGVESIAEAVTQARFVGTDLASDEVVLMKILQTLRTLLLTPVGVFMSNDSVCGLMQSCFRICFEPRLSELLRRSAEQTLMDMIHLLFSRLDELSPQDKTLTPDLHIDRVQPEPEPVSTSVLAQPIPEESTRPVVVGDGTPLVDDPFGEPASSIPTQPKDATLASKPEADLQRDAPVHDDLSSSPVLVHASDTPHTPGALPKLGLPHGEDGKKQHAHRLSTSSMRALLPSPSSPLPSSSKDSKTLVPYGVPCLRELLRFLISLIDPRNKANTESMISLALSLLIVTFETGGKRIHRFPSLMEQIEDSLCRHLLLLLKHENIGVYTTALRVCFLLFEAQRAVLKFQLEHFLTAIMEAVFSSTEHRELALESIVQVCRIPSFAVDLYVSFDCDMYSNNLFETLTKYLARVASHPPNPNIDPPPLTTNFLALKALMALMRDLAGPILSHGLSPVPPSKALSLPSIEALHDNKRKKLILQSGMEKFNKSAKEGIAYLVQEKVLHQPLLPQEVAQFLRSDPRLNKQQIGEYIGNSKNKDVLDQFVKTFDFSGKGVDESIRAFLASFRLPGESQIIERIFECFAEVWFTTNISNLETRVVENRDGIFVLCYSIMMLHTDLHSPKTKNPMTLEQFIKNQRGMNNGKDFPRDFLTGIYHNIKSKEIVMAEERDGELKEDHLWKVTLERGRSPSGTMISCHGTTQYNEEIFSHMWLSSLSSLGAIFDLANDDFILDRVLDGYTACAKIAFAYNQIHVFDKIIIDVCKRTRLLDGDDPTTPIDVQLQAFLKSTKARKAAEKMVALTHSFGNILREGWKNFLFCLSKLYLGQLLPPTMLEADDFVRGTITLYRDSKKHDERQSQGFSFFSDFFFGGNAQAATSKEARQLLESERKSLQKTFFDAKLTEIFCDSKYLEKESLGELIKVLIYLSQSKKSHAQAGLQYNENLSVFFLDMLASVALQNKDRLHHYWPSLHVHLRDIISGSQEFDFLVERAIVNLIKIAIKLLSKETIAGEIIQSLEILLSLHPDVERKILHQELAGLSKLIKSNAEIIEHRQGWGVILQLLERAKNDPSCIATACTSLIYMITEVNFVDTHNFGMVQSVLFSYCAALRSEPPPPPTSMPSSSTPTQSSSSPPSSPTPVRQPSTSTQPSDPISPTQTVASALPTIEETAMTILSLLSALHVRVMPVFAQSTNISIHSLWTSYWQNILLAMANLCLDKRRSVRHKAFEGLQRSLLLPDLNRLSAIEWKMCLEVIMFPLMGELLDNTHNIPQGDLEELRERAYTLPCKVFLQHLDVLPALSDFTSLWFRLLDVMRKFMQAGNSEVLADAVPEILKNMLLIMSTTSNISATPVPVQQGRHDPFYLWKATWDMLDQFLPGLREQTFGSEGNVSQSSAPLTIPLDLPPSLSLEVHPTSSGPHEHHVPDASPIKASPAPSPRDTHSPRPHPPLPASIASPIGEIMSKPSVSFTENTVPTSLPPNSSHINGSSPFPLNPQSQFALDPITILTPHSPLDTNHSSPTSDNQQPFVIPFSFPVESPGTPQPASPLERSAPTSPSRPPQFQVAGAHPFEDIL